MSARLSCWMIAALALISVWPTSILAAPAEPTPPTTTSPEKKAAAPDFDIAKFTYTQYRTTLASPHFGIPREGDVFTFTSAARLDKNMKVVDAGIEMVGALTNEVKIMQIIDKDTMLVSVESNYQDIRGGTARMYDKRKNFISYVRGVPTKGFYDGDEIDLSKTVFLCKGPYTYKTPQGGTNTVPLIEMIQAPVPTESEKNAFAKTDADATADQAKRAEASKQRIYTVHAGDTLASISQKFFGDKTRANDIYNANRKTLGDNVAPKIGQKLIIPTQ